MGEPARTPQISAPQLLSPVNGATMDNGCLNQTDGVIWDFDWSDVPGATAYQIRVWKNQALPVANTVVDDGSSSFQHNKPKNFIANPNRFGWRWRVRAGRGLVWGRWSAIGNFNAERLNTDCP